MELEAEKHSKGEFLATQAEDAQDAIKHMILRMKEQVTDALRTTSREAKGLAGETYENHTLVTLGAAMVGGIVAGSLLVKSKEKKMIAELARLEKAMALAGGENVTFHNARPKEEGSFSKLLKMGMRRGAPVILSALTAKLAAGQEVAGGEGEEIPETERMTPS